MRKTWSLRLALSLSFLQAYLRHADKLTIEDCQGRSRSIPFMTAPAGIRVNKIKIPAFPFRNRAESIVYEHLTEQERGWLHWHRKEADDGDHCQGEANRSKASREQEQRGGLSVKVQRETDVELDMIQTDRKMTRSKKTGKKAQKEDQFAEGLDAEWLEYVGPAETDADKAEMTSDNMAAVLYFHGGGYYTGSKEEHRVLIGPLVRRLGKHVRILTINYRLAPQHPFPAALVDALSCYMWLLYQSVSETFGLATANPQRPTDNFQPRQIVFMGDSAGGGLALALSLLLRDHASPSIPQPVKIVTWSPWLDLSQALPSFKENALTDCIPYEDFTHLHSDAVDGMFGHVEFPEEAQEGGKVVRQRAQVYCPDSCLKMKYVSPLYENDFSGIPDVLIVCGSAERFANECILMANRLEEQQQTCRIDIHEDMPHIFPLFRFHPSSAAALDRTSAFIREAVAVAVSADDYTLEASGRNGRTGRNRSDSVVIPISPSSSSGSSSASLSPLPSPSPSPRLDIGELIDGVDEEGYFQDERGAHRIRRVGSSSSLSSAGSNPTSATLQQQQREQRQRKRREFDTQPVQSLNLDLAEESHHQNLKTKKKKKRTAVNVIDLSGTSVMSYHKQTRFGTPSDRDRALQETEEAGLLDGGRRRRKRNRLTLQDVVTDATVYEWEVLLRQGYIPTRHWPLPPTGGGRSSVQARRRRV
ncbi:hypothetical protein KI688_008767 [Linnemannia hyalina]|uniref:Alpha/beta hydrolase fold-3 domain-containing protein n=1 Tax=Linnemannia hyalina TaxID=64524 RepID=A0A9P7Y1W3_9FUNG|nr:hypothetical protein KI688_008767 [Linnemannia hyalina]